ncbi:MAG TPA: hypothetical protein VN682_11775 [Terriglobales bacterium]|jgi:hypothetical protein|nr:hypothetical protein [Terriglobales bacterium]
MTRLRRVWSWFMLAADPSPPSEKDRALRALYGDARVVARTDLQTKTDASK